MSDSPDSELPEREPDMPDDALGLGLSEPIQKPLEELAPEQKKLSEPKEPENSNMGQVVNNPAYRVLARKYRPQNFKELIGQDAMVQTLGNAIKRGRLAHAFLMTGVRGVGKTSTARLIAKALNCIGEDGQGAATIDPCGKCEPCQAIAEGRHIDVIEMDAASHTGVDDVREIIEAVRYASVSARYKIYIIDEVHMLSKNAFNALLKTLEEPPAHVKFLFATTEVNKVPITVLSRCQRFDLKRISVQELADHFAHITALENVKAEEEALALIARSAEGSVRDGLSILDQAIAHADWSNEANDANDLHVTALQVRDMLGLSDRSAIRTLLSKLLQGDVEQVMDIARSQYQLGIEPNAILSGLLREVHMITLAKLNILHDPAMAAEAKEILSDWGDRLSFPQLHRLWQLMLKGHEEVQKAAMPSEACDMALLRIMHASQMPDPTELMELIKDGANGGAQTPSASSASSASSDAIASENIVKNDSETQLNETKVSEMPTTAEEALHSQVEQSNHFSNGIDSSITNDSYEASNNIETVSDKEQKVPATFNELIDKIAETKHMLGSELHDNVRLVKYDPPYIEYQLVERSSAKFLNDFKQALLNEMGMRWTLTLNEDAQAQPSRYEQEKLDKAAARQLILDTPMVKAAIAAFPDAKLAQDMMNNERSIG